MQLSADRVYAEPKNDDYPYMFGFRDSAADYVLILSRFSDLEPDEGLIELIVRDQMCTHTDTLTVYLARSRCIVRLDERTAERMLGISEYHVTFQVDAETYRRMSEVLRVIFDGLPGLTIDHAESDP
jgi:hypothetical protein